MSRFETIPNADIVFEAVAPQVTIFWNPENEKGSVQFWVEHQEFRKTSNTELQFVNRTIDDRWEMRPLSVPLVDVIPDTFDVTLPDGTTTQVTGGFLMLAIKSAFDKYYTAKSAELNAPEELDEDPPAE